MKVLFHIDESDRWGRVLGNAKNLLGYGRAAAVPLDIEIVANGPAVGELTPQAAKRAGFAEDFASLSASVRFCACNNALIANDVPPGELLDFVRVVPAGVAELALRQEQGYSYIKP